MSHFAVAVICDDISNLSDILAPYQENNCKDCPEQYLVFNDIEDEYLKEYEENCTPEWHPDFHHRLENNDENQINKIKSEGRFTFVQKDKFNFNRISIGSKVKVVNSFNNGQTEMCEYVNLRIDNFRRFTHEEIMTNLGFKGLLALRRSFDSKFDFSKYLRNIEEIEINATVIEDPKQIPFKDVYSTFEDFMELYSGYKQRDPKTNRYGYWENPNAKWDWYSVGGRWMGSLLIKDDKDGCIGKPGVFNNDLPNTPEGYNFVDVCRVSDVCWDKMQEIKKYELLVDEETDGDLWDIVTGKTKLSETKRSDYTLYKPEYFIEKYGNKENYIKSITSFSTYAVITPDGIWHSPGEMGWFGCSSESNEESNKFKNDYYENFIKPYQDKFIIIVDCHI